LAAAAAGDQDAAEDTGALGTEFGYGLWEDEAEREKWRVADWTEEDEARMDGSIYEWIRMDADFEWIAEIRHEQADYMWVSQLQRDRDVVAQLEVSRRRSYCVFVDLCYYVSGYPCSGKPAVRRDIQFLDSHRPCVGLLLPRQS